MARRRAARKQGGGGGGQLSKNAVTGIICSVVGAALVVFFVFMWPKMGAKKRLEEDSVVPTNILSTQASQLTGNEYVISGEVVERITGKDDNEIVVVLYKDNKGKETVISIVVTEQAKGDLNISRNRKYRIRFEIQNLPAKGDTDEEMKGICVAQEIEAI